MRISDPAWYDNEPPCYLEPELEHPLFMEAVDQALALCSEEGGPPHVKLVLEWTPNTKNSIIADDLDIVEEHSSVKQLKTQAMQGGAPLTLEECLRHYTKAETLTMEDAWRCPHCQQYLPVVKTLDIWSLPDILVVHFKRFRQHTLRGPNSTKLTTMVEFPVYGFDMTPHLANKQNTALSHSNNSDQQNPVIMNGVNWSPWKRPRKPSSCSGNIYDLYAVCYHHGTDIETGHYTAACRNPYDNQWYLYDDAKVSNLSKEINDISSVLVNNSAYILFYQKRNGVYINSSSSSAASTSSVGSSGDHWVGKMPKFILPKQYKNTDKPTSQTITDKEDEKTEKTQDEELKNSESNVSLRNSQNTLHSSNNNSEQKFTENKATNTSELLNSPTSCLDHTKDSRPIYKTSIYINSTGNVDIMTTCENSSPVLSNHRINGLLNEDANVINNDQINGFIDEPETCYLSETRIQTV